MGSWLSPINVYKHSNTHAGHGPNSWYTSVISEKAHTHLGPVIRTILVQENKKLESAEALDETARHGAENAVQLGGSSTRVKEALERKKGFRYLY